MNKLDLTDSPYMISGEETEVQQYQNLLLTSTQREEMAFYYIKKHKGQIFTKDEMDEWQTHERWERAFSRTFVIGVGAQFAAFAYLGHFNWRYLRFTAGFFGVTGCSMCYFA